LPPYCATLRLPPLGYTFVFPFGHALSRGCSRHSRAPTSPPRLCASARVLLPARRRCAPEFWVRSAIRPYPGLRSPVSGLRSPVSPPPLRLSARSHFLPFAAIFSHSRAPSPLRGCASRSLCRFAALELRSHPTHMAERVGFEPTGPCGPPVFKTGALDHSATSP
jgi:hypothetical protein